MTTLRPLLLDTRDGEWGKPEPAQGRVEMRVIRGTDFDSVRVGQVENVPTRFLEERHAERKRLQPWDIVFETAGGSPQKPTGRSLLLTPRTFDLLGPDVTCASFARFLRVDPGQADPAFVFWMLQHHYETRDLLQFHTQHTGVARFQFTVFSKTFDFSLPPLETQRRIAAILGAYDDLIEVNRRRVAVLEEMARGLFEEWFVRFRFPGHEEVTIVDTPDGPLPDGWARSRLETWCDLMRSGSTPPRKIEEYWQDGNLPWYTTGELWDGFLLGSSEHVTESAVEDRKARVFEADTIFMAIYGSPTVGRMGIATERCSTNQAALAMRPDPSACGLWFLYFTLFSLRAKFNSLAQGAAQQNISKAKVAETAAVQPPKDLIDRFEALVDPIMRLRGNVEKATVLLSSSRDLLLPRLISGQLSVEAAERQLENVA